VQKALGLVSIVLAGACAFGALLAPTLAHAQSDAERAGHSRGGYAWGQEHHEDSGPSGPVAHHYGRGFLSAGVGGTVRMLQYLDLSQDRLAPPYLQFRGGYFFESDGMLQHGVVLGVATPMTGDGASGASGLDGFTQWTLAPAYALRIIPEGDLGDWFQAYGRFGVPISLGPQFSWGLELAIGAQLKPWDGFGFYGEIDLSNYFANSPDVAHPLISFEIGLVLDLPEILP
jgi:opacity protein-like surface antigen